MEVRVGGGHVYLRGQLVCCTLGKQLSVYPCSHVVEHDLPPSHVGVSDVFPPSPLVVLVEVQVVPLGECAHESIQAFL